MKRDARSPLMSDSKHTSNKPTAGCWLLKLFAIAFWAILSAVDEHDIHGALGELLADLSFVQQRLHGSVIPFQMESLQVCQMGGVHTVKRMGPARDDGMTYMSMSCLSKAVFNTTVVCSHSCRGVRL